MITVPTIIEYMSYCATCLLNEELKVLRASKYCFRTFLPRFKSISELFPSKYSLIQLPWDFSAILKCSYPGSEEKGRKEKKQEDP